MEMALNNSTEWIAMNNFFHLQFLINYFIYPLSLFVGVVSTQIQLSAFCKLNVLFHFLQDQPPFFLSTFWSLRSSG